MKQRAMGEFTVAQEGESWIVLEDGRRIGGTLRYPFPSREAAQRYVERELAGEAEMSRDGRLRSQWQDLPHRRNARREASVRPNKIEWERYTILMSIVISRAVPELTTRISIFHDREN